LALAHSIVETPQFMPVATQASVRAQRTESLAGAGATMLLANTWHLAQSPGLDVFEALGGVRRFMGWSGGVLTDSGGFQVFSLGEHASIDDEGVRLRHPGSGRALALTPESCVAAQRAIGSDIAMVLDHCVASTVAHGEARAAMARTHRWAARCLAARGDAPMGLFGIVQGACHADLRRESADVLRTMSFDGYAIGGLAVGEGKAEREEMTALVAERLPEDRPRYLMGVGTPLDLLEAVHRGVDLFDCILPTSLAQRGRVYTSLGRLELRRGVYRLQDRPLDPACDCEVCGRYSRAYLHHLFAAREPLAWTLLGLHNLHFWLGLMRRIRAALADGRFRAFYDAERQVLDQPDPDDPPVATPPKRRRRAPEQLGRWALHTVPAFGDAPAATSIRDTISGEVMHAVSAPDAEARRLYVDQPGLRGRAHAAGPPLVVWDVGLGAASNAIEVVRAWEEELVRGAPRVLRLVSFERDLDALRLARAWPDHFPRLKHGGPAGILADGRWESRVKLGEAPAITWELREGDFLERLEGAPPADLVLYDPFSLKVDSPLWSLDAFRRVRAALGDRDTVLYTYTNSTAARVALLVAGFYIGAGAGTGPKAQTTIATTRPNAAMLGTEFLDKWRRSSARWPAGLPEAERAAVEAALLAHRQWRVEAADRPGGGDTRGQSG
jgi:queuine tRNA-ribosyltransferase